jgi:hypothetical protein
VIYVLLLIGFTVLMTIDFFLFLLLLLLLQAVIICILERNKKFNKLKKNIT